MGMSNSSFLVSVGPLTFRQSMAHHQEYAYHWVQRMEWGLILPPLQVWGGISFDWVTAPYRGRNPVGANSTCSFWKPLLPGAPSLSLPPRVLSEWSFKLLVVRSLLFLSWHRVWFLQLQMRAGTKRIAMLLPKRTGGFGLDGMEGLSLAVL